MNKLSLIILLCFSAISYCQISKELPSIIPPSPKATTFHKYGDYPVSHDTGIPDISIPLYTIKSGDLEVPIVLRYYASGTRPDEPDMSNVGYGWTLEAGGRISRTVRDNADERGDRIQEIKTSINQYKFSDLEYLQIHGGNSLTDTEYDIYSYSVNGLNGKFILDGGRGKLFPYKPYRITRTPVLSGYYDHGMDMVSDSGTSFRFGYTERESVSSPRSSSWSATSSWLLERMLSANGKDSIVFDYEEAPQYTKPLAQNDRYSATVHDYWFPLDEERNYMIALFPSYSNSQDYGPQTVNDVSVDDAGSSPSQEIYYKGIRTIKSINFSNGRVDFEIDPNDKLRIRKMKIWDLHENLIRSIAFNNTTVFPGGLGYTKLSSIDIMGTEGDVEETYVFSYDDRPIDLAYTTDFWGFFKNNDLGIGLTARRIKGFGPGESGSYMAFYEYATSLGSINRDPINTACKRFVLTGIEYPTKGSTTFQYGNNKYVNNQGQVKLGGGLRIEKITNDDGKGNKYVKSYVYEPATIQHDIENEANYTTTSYSVKPFPFISTQFPNVSRLAYYYLLMRSRTFYNSITPGLGQNNIYYQNITEFSGTSPTTSNGKIEYNYSTPDNDQYFPGGLGQLNYQVMPSGSPRLSSIGLGGSGNLRSTKEYKRIGVGTDLQDYSLVKETSFRYTKNILDTYLNLQANKLTKYFDYFPTFGPSDFSIPLVEGALSLLGLRAKLTYFYVNGPNAPLSDPIPDGYYTDAQYPFPPPYSVNTYTIPIGRNLLKSKTVTEYYPDADHITKINFYYDNPSNLYLTREARSTSVGDTLVTSYEYVADRTEIPYTAMKLKNIQAPLVNTSVYRKDAANIRKNISSIETHFKEWGDSLFLPDSVKTLKGTHDSSSNTMENRVVYHDYYPNGNVKEVSKEDGTHIVYIWGYDKQYPIAKIENATYSEVESQVGTLQSLSNADGGTCLDSGSCDEKNLRNALTTLRNTSSLSDAMVTTYTYDPLVGVTSMTDPRGYTIYYEYDDFNRLKEVRDDKGNLVSDYEYKYKGE